MYIWIFRNNLTKMDVSFVYFFFVICYTVAISHGIDVSDLNIIKAIQNMFCIPENACSNMDYIPGSQLPSGDETIPLPHDDDKITIPANISLPALYPFLPSPSCCGKCLCNTEYCKVSDSCCIQTLEELFPIEDTEVVMTCDYPQLRPKNMAYPNTGVPILMLRECPKERNVNKEIVEKCEQSDKYYNIDTKIPVTDNETMYIYKNRFCAFCHNITETTLVYWDVALECLHGFLKPKNISSVVTEVLESESCNLKYSRPFSHRQRVPVFQCTEVISKCNVTGHWKTYDSFIEAACLTYSTIYNFKYRNVFCYLCNTNDTIGLYHCTETPRPNIFVDFKALLRLQPEINLSVDDSKQTNKCPKNALFDPVKQQCRDIECLFPKTVENGACVNLVEYLGGIMYGLYLKLTPLQELDVYYLEDLSILASEIKEEIFVHLSEFIPNKSVLSFSLYLKFNNFKISYFVGYLQIDCGTLSLVKSDIVDKLLSFHDTILSTYSHIYNGTINKYFVEIDMYQADFTIANQFHKSLFSLHPIFLDSKLSRNPLTVLSLPYDCPAIRLLSNEFNILLSPGSIYIEEYNTSINSSAVLLERLQGGNTFSIRVCTTLFDRIVKQFSTMAKSAKTICKKEIFNVKTILTFVCTIISICFSILTILVYMKFKKCDTQPVVNNIVLCLCLISAQSLYQFGSGQSCNVSELSCQVIGVLVHFSWLFLMFWMNSCCIHMFRVFKLNQSKIAVFNISKTTLVYTGYSASCTLILVMTNIILSLITSDWSDIGYGGSLCYISQPHMVAYLFALPVAAIVVSNILLFTTVVIQMRSTSKVQNNTNKQQYLPIYVKLSTLTGSTWVFGFCSFFFDVAVLDYIFIILNASQGMFLFFAFIANLQTLKGIFGRNCKEQAVENQFSNIGNATVSSALSQ